MFSNLPNTLLTARLKQTTNQLTTGFLSTHRVYLATTASKGGPNINLEILRNIDGILDWNVDCPEEKIVLLFVERRTRKTLFLTEDQSLLRSPLFLSERRRRQRALVFLFLQSVRSLEICLRHPWTPEQYSHWANCRRQFL